MLVFKIICCSCGGPSLVPSFYTVAKNLIHTASFRKIWCPLLVSEGIAQNGAQIHIGTHTQRKIFSKKEHTCVLHITVSVCVEWGLEINTSKCQVLQWDSPSNIILYIPSVPLLGYLFKRKKNLRTYVHKDLYPISHSSTLLSIQMCTNWWIDNKMWYKMNIASLECSKTENFLGIMSVLKRFQALEHFKCQGLGSLGQKSLCKYSKIWKTLKSRAL